jgi:hypothetical protein
MGYVVPACLLRYVTSTVHQPSSSILYPTYALPVLLNLDDPHGYYTIA